MSRQSWDALEDHRVLFGHFSTSDAGPARHPKGSSREVVPRRRTVDDDLNLFSGLELYSGSSRSQGELAVIFHLAANLQLSLISP